jgi:voltage-gated potassium channel
MEKAKIGDIPSFVFDWSLVILISLNVLSVILESFSNLKLRYEGLFAAFEFISVLIFTIEYLLRIWTSNLKYPRRNRIFSVLAFMLSGMAFIDLLSILPFYIPIATSIDLRVLRVLRLTRILRILKIGRYSASMALIGRVLKRSKADLIVTLFVTFLLLLLASSLMYYIENPVQPDKFPNIVASAWWTIVTLTTVGYGDVYPVTVLGKVLGGVSALLGISLVALPTGIISSGFMEEIRLKNQATKKNENKLCPHCGLPIEDHIDAV